MKHVLISLFTIISLAGCGSKRISDEQASQVDFTDEAIVLNHVIDSTLMFMADSSYYLLNLNTNDTSTFENDNFLSYKNGKDSIVIDSVVFYVVEGDLVFDLDELYNYYNNIQQPLELEELKIDKTDRLIIDIADGKMNRWPENKVINYCIQKASFRSSANYAKMINNMRLATADWQNACNVKFNYVAEKDPSPIGSLPSGIDFVVREIDASNSFIAKAFFPNDPTYKRKLLLDLSYYSTSFDKVGVLRHELGHVLGFRHEHIRSGAPASCPNEKGAIIDLTQYDPKSVMHYFCGNVGSKELKITEIDVSGAQKVYGSPALP